MYQHWYMLFGWAKCGKLLRLGTFQKSDSQTGFGKKGLMKENWRGWQRETISSLLFDWFGGDRICMLEFYRLSVSHHFHPFHPFLGLMKKPWTFCCPVRKHTHSFLCGETVGGYTIWVLRISHSKGKGGNTSIGRVGLSSLLPTLPETNSSWTPENVWLEDKMSLLGADC